MASQPSTHKRIRSRRACLPCQQRKRKCDGNQPCSSCDGYGYSCIYDKADNAPPTPQTTPPLQDVELRHRITCVAGDVIESIKRHVLPKPAVAETQILDATKSRFYGRHSAIAFPHLLGLELQADPTPKLQCHAWNIDIYKRPSGRSISRIVDAVDAASARRCTETFFERVSPVFEILNADVFHERCATLWAGAESEGFSCLATAVIVVGSYFADEPLENELEISKLCDDMLQDPAITYDVNPCHIAAMVYNTLYMRLTSYHSVAWARSCTTLHTLESIGLHKDFEELSKAAGQPQLVDPDELVYRSKIFWVGWQLHQTLALQCGRAPVQLDEITVRSMYGSPDENATAAMLDLYKSAPRRDITHLMGKTSTEQSQYFGDTLKKLREAKKLHPIVSLTAAEIASSVYRRLLVAGAKFDNANQIHELHLLYDEALGAADKLLQAGLPWWHLVDSVFQLTIVMISIDSPRHIGVLRKALKTAEAVDEHFDTENTHDSVEVCHMLVRALIAKKRRDLAALDGLSASVTPSAPEPMEQIAEQTVMTDDPMFSNTDFPDLLSQFSAPFEWTGNSGVEWTEF